jgi:hypothetical protein
MDISKSCTNSPLGVKIKDNLEAMIQNYFFVVADAPAKKAAVSVPEKFFQASPMFASKTGTFIKRAPYSAPL